MNTEDPDFHTTKIYIPRIKELEAQIRKLEERLKEKVSLDVLFTAELYQEEIKELKAKLARYEVKYLGRP